MRHIGEGTMSHDGDNLISLADDEILIPEMFCDVQNKIFVQNMISSTYPNFEGNRSKAFYLRERAILTPTNQTVGQLNSIIVDRLPGEIFSYVSLDVVEDFGGTQQELNVAFPVEYLNSVSLPGLPLHEMKLKVGVVVMLIRNLNQILGLCNGMQMIVKQYLKYCVECEVICRAFIDVVGVVSEIKAMKYLTNRNNVVQCYLDFEFSDLMCQIVCTVKNDLEKVKLKFDLLDERHTVNVTLFDKFMVDVEKALDKAPGGDFIVIVACTKVTYLKVKMQIGLYGRQEESEDEQDDQILVVQAMEQQNKGPQKQVVLELEEDDEYYTLDQLDEMDQSITYLARKFSHIRVKKPRFKIRCFNCDELDHFATECRKPKKSGKAYIVEGKSWDDTDVDDEDEEVGNYALMDFEHGEASNSKSKVPTLTTIYLNASQYKETMEKISVEIFHIHTSLLAATEEVSRLTKANEKLESEKQKMDLLLVELESIKQENEYLKNKLKCSNEILVVLREKIEKNEVKLKSFRNASELKDIGGKGKATENEDVPALLKKVDSPMFKACEIDFSEEELIIKQEIADEDNGKKNAETTSTSKYEKKPMVNQDCKTPVKEMKTGDARKKNKIRNGKIGIKKATILLILQML
ncbi:hypothetical protein AgCh_012074 [Apium graveolens]